MAHNFMKQPLHGTATGFSPLILTLGIGSLLQFNSLVGQLYGSDPTLTQSLAMIGAIFLCTPLVFQALLDLFRKESQMNELAALGTLAAIATESYLTAGAISFFMSLASFLEQQSSLGAQNTIRKLIDMAPEKATIELDNGQFKEIDAEALQPGDLIRILPGDKVAGDGTVIRGESLVNEANITGESFPREVFPKDQVFASSQNISGTLQVRISKSGANTTFNKVQELIQQAEASKTPFMRIVDEYAKWYVPLVLILAATVLFFTHDINRTIAILVIACPCAIILSGPSAVVAAMSAAARLGVLIKDVNDLERAGQIDAIAFDKTGTLTTGELHVKEITTYNDHDESKLIQQTTSILTNSRHPIARALQKYHLQQNESSSQMILPVEKFTEFAGHGCSGTIDQSIFLAGKLTWLTSKGVNPPENKRDVPSSLSELHVSMNNKLIGKVSFEDRVRSGLQKLFSKLDSLGVARRLILTGDRDEVARSVGELAGCSEIHSEIHPQRKMEIVNQLKSEGHSVAVMGDGVNDAPALSAGDISISMGLKGSDIAISAASITLMNNHLNRIPFIISLARQTRSVIIQNLFLSIGFIGSLLFLSAIGFIHPVFAVFLHTISDFAVLINSARLLRQGEDIEQCHE